MSEKQNEQQETKTEPTFSPCGDRIDLGYNSDKDSNNTI